MQLESQREGEREWEQAKMESLICPQCILGEAVQVSFSFLWLLCIAWLHILGGRTEYIRNDPQLFSPINRLSFFNALDYGRVSEQKIGTFSQQLSIERDGITSFPGSGRRQSFS